MLTRQTSKVLLLLALPVLLLFSCDAKRVFEENRKLEKGIWDSGEKLTFSVAIADTGQPYSVYLNVRNAMEYPYSNLYLFLNTVFPDGRVARDTVELTLADYDGRWLGSGLGSVKFSRFLFQKGVRFHQVGIHLFEFEQGMRVRQLAGIRDFGLRMEKE
jgi:gliding motility-associated lipoprotein GldH